METQVILAIIGLLLTTAIASAGWVNAHRRAYQQTELQKVFATKEDVQALRQEINGARQAMRKEAEALKRMVQQAEAEASLAVRNADTALSETHETRHIVEIQHQGVMENFVKPFQETNRALHEVTTTIARHSAFLEQLMRTWLPPKST